MVHLHFENNPWRWPSIYAAAVVQRLKFADPKSQYSHRDLGPLNMFDEPATVGEGVFRRGWFGWQRQVAVIRHWTDYSSNGPGNITIDSTLDRLLPETELRRIIESVKAHEEPQQTAGCDISLYLGPEFLYNNGGKNDKRTN